MNRLMWLIVLPFVLLACGGQGGPGESATDTMADFSQPHSSLAQLMRGLLYPNSEIIFATQGEDPEIAAAAAKAADPFGASALYGGWESVENAALMLSEAANLIMIPGRLCENGLPVPLANQDFRMYAQQLIEAGRPRTRRRGPRTWTRCSRPAESFPTHALSVTRPIVTSRKEKCGASRGSPSCLRR